MKASEFEKQFAAGEDVTEALDLTRARRLRQEPERVNVDLPVWMIEALDKEAKRLATTRQAIIRAWIAERLDRAAYAGSAPGKDHAAGRLLHLSRTCGSGRGQSRWDRDELHRR